MGEEDILTLILLIEVPEVRICVQDQQVVWYTFEDIAQNEELMCGHIIDQGQIIANSIIGVLVEILIPTLEKLAQSHINVGEKNYEAASFVFPLFCLFFLGPLSGTWNDSSIVR